MVSKSAPKESYEIVPSTATGSERVGYSLVGRGAGTDQGHEHLRFGTHEEAMSHMESQGLAHYAGPRRTHLGDDPSRR